MELKNANSNGYNEHCNKESIPNVCLFVFKKSENCVK